MYIYIYIHIKKKKHVYKRISTWYKSCVSCVCVMYKCLKLCISTVST